VDNGFITTEVFSGVVGMVLITTLVTPPLLRSAFTEKKERKNSLENQTGTD
jgi:hypothetical protein